MNVITPQTTREELLKDYASYPDTAPDGFQPFHASRVNPIYWDIEEGSSVLDVGCNSGEFMRKLIEGNRNITVKGIDVSEVAIEAAKKKGLDVILGDGEFLPFSDESFDYVVLMEVLSHVHDPKKVLEEIKRVLKQDGVLLGSCPHKNLELNVWDDKRMHRAYYTTNQLQDLLYSVFQGVYTKVLTGAQFSMAMAGTTIGNQEAEVLFKAGSPNLKCWDYKLLDKSQLRVWMGPTQGAGDVYYRMSGFADKMNEIRGVDVLYSRFSYDGSPQPGEWQTGLTRAEGNLPHNQLLLTQLDGMLKIADLSVWQITASWSVLAFFEALKDIRKKPFITEIDDWLFDVPSQNIASYPYKPNSEPEQIAYRQIQMSDALIVSTEFIKEGMEALFPGKKVYVVPNGLDFGVWDNLKHPPKDAKIKIGYTGCQNHGGDIGIVKKPILALLDEFPDLEFIMAVPFESWDNVNHPRVYRNTQWAPINLYPQMVANWNLDIGIAPLKDSNFNRAKSNLRWLEYSALKIPTVASKVYPFENSIRQGQDGFICNSPQAWYDTLKELIQDRKRRTSVGMSAYNRVKFNFSMGQIAKKYAAILKEIKDESR